VGEDVAFGEEATGVAGGPNAVGGQQINGETWSDGARSSHSSGSGGGIGGAGGSAGGLSSALEGWA